MNLFGADAYTHHECEKTKKKESAQKTLCNIKSARASTKTTAKKDRREKKDTRQQKK